MKGMILAGGLGTKLHPLTEITNKPFVAAFREQPGGARVMLLGRRRHLRIAARGERAAA